MFFFALFNTLFLLVNNGAVCPNPNPSPAASGFFLPWTSGWGREICLIEGAALYQALTPRPSDN
jgi:hypothetical protein